MISVKIKAARQHGGRESRKESERECVLQDKGNEEEAEGYGDFVIKGFRVQGRGRGVGFIYRVSEGLGFRGSRFNKGFKVLDLGCGI
jgi:hypothetical protein